MSKDTELKAEKKPEGKEIFRWSPPATAQKSVSDDVPEEYVVTEVADACSGGIVIWAKYNGKWRANPWNTRTLVKHLLNHRPAVDSEAEIRFLEADNNCLEGMLENMQDDNVAKEAKLAEAEKREAGLREALENWVEVEKALGRDRCCDECDEELNELHEKSIERAVQALEHKGEPAKEGE